MELTIGASVCSLDRACGRLDQVVIDPETGRVCLLVVRWQGRRIGVPFDCIKAAGPKRIELNLSRGEVDRLLDYEVRGLVSPAAGWVPPRTEPDEEVIPQPVPHPADAPPLFPIVLVPGEPLVEVELQLAPENAVELGRVPVETSDGPVGHLRGVGVDQSGWVAHLVVRGNRPTARTIVVPAGAIAELTGEAARLRLDRRGFEQLPSAAA